MWSNNIRGNRKSEGNEIVLSILNVKIIFQYTGKSITLVSFASATPNEKHPS